MMKLPEQLERLLSERRDGGLNAEEIGRVERALAEDASAAEVARRYARLDRLLARWRRPPADVDWQALARQTAERVTASAADQGVDELLERWAGPAPEVDWDALKSRISRAVHAEAARAAEAAAPVKMRWRRAANWGVRVAAPLAAAAVVALVVWGPWSAGPRTTPIAGPVKAPIVLVSLEWPATPGTVSVTFENGSTGAVIAANETGPFSEGGVQFLAPSVVEPLDGPDGGVAISVGASNSNEYPGEDDSSVEAWLY